MRIIEKIQGISKHDFSGNIGKVVTTKGAEYIFNQYEEKQWVRHCLPSPPVRGSLKIDLRLNRVIFVA
jgi:hypothetical protein